MDEKAVLLDRVYEAALLPEMWPDVLENFAALSRTEGGILYVVTPTRVTDDKVTLSPIPRWTASRSMTDYVETFIRDGWLHANVRAERAVRLAHAGFVTDGDLFTSEELETHPFYLYARDRSVGWHAGLAVQAPSGDVAIFNFERLYADGPVDRQTIAVMDEFKADLARASLMSSRLGMERARSMATTLAMLGLPGAVLSGTGAIIAANELFEGMMTGILGERSGSRLYLTDARADALLRGALENACASSEGRRSAAVASIALPSRGGEAAMILHVIPVRRAARDVFSNATSVILLTPVAGAEIPAAGIIRGLFDLTAAESKVARRIALGETIHDIARATTLSEGTIRTQLKSIFAKTGVSRQAELVALLSGLNAFHPTVPDPS